MMLSSWSPLAIWSALFVVCLLHNGADAFVSSSKTVAHSQMETSISIFDKVGEFFGELDAFMDDATSRRLGAGAQFYGKRKSGFYGSDDKGRKKDRSMPDPLGKSVALFLFVYSNFPIC